jgi:hypothetical protein
MLLEMYNLPYMHECSSETRTVMLDALEDAGVTLLRCQPSRVGKIHDRFPGTVGGEGGAGRSTLLRSSSRQLRRDGFALTLLPWAAMNGHCIEWKAELAGRV